MSELDRYRVLIFDETVLEPGLSYNQKEDHIEGFHDTGAERKIAFADHAMVFMARGIRRKWKQPIAFYFVENGMPSMKIAVETKRIIRHLQGIGLHIVATVCDQSAANCTAIKYLQQETAMNCVQGKAWKIRP